MQIVIDIPESEYEYMKSHDDAFGWYDVKQLFLKAVRNGTVLPKGHGRLISADLLIEQYKEYCKANCKYTEKQRNVMCRACATGDAIEMLENTPTVLGARNYETNNKRRYLSVL